jgi:hypothetical protein
MQFIEDLIPLDVFPYPMEKGRAGGADQEECIGQIPLQLVSDLRVRRR